MQSVLIPQSIITALQQCIDAGAVPSARQGTGGNSHVVWFLSFSLIKNQKCVQFTAKATSSYSAFLEFVAFDGPGFDGLTERASMAQIVELAKKNLAAA